MDTKKWAGWLFPAGVLMIVVAIISYFLGPEANPYTYRLFQIAFCGLSLRVWLLILGLAISILGSRTSR